MRQTAAVDHRPAPEGAHPSAGRQDIYASVTARIIAELEEGRLPWVRPWDTGFPDPGLPRNVLSRRPYSGINILILWGAVHDAG